MSSCFWCGKPNGEIVLCGQLPGDAEAPRQIVCSYEPCSACEEKMQAGVVLVEVTPEPGVENQPPIAREKGQRAYPTGHWCVVTRDGIERVLEPDAAAQVLERGKAFIDLNAWELIGLPRAGKSLHPGAVKEG